MKKIVGLLLLFLFVLNNLGAQQADSLPRKSNMHQQGFLVYAEIGGHNYYSFENDKASDFFSLNLGYRKAIIENELYAMLSAGYGIFKQMHYEAIPNKPVKYYYDWVNYFPLELSFQFGKGPHAFEAGYSVTTGLGRQWIYYGSSVVICHFRGNRN